MTQPSLAGNRTTSRRRRRPDPGPSRRRGRGTAATGAPAVRPGRATTPPSAPTALEAALAQALAAGAPRAVSFAELGVPPLLVEALRRRGLVEPFAIQARTLPDALAGRDVLGRAATGSGKTLAFGLPLLARLGGHGAHRAGRKGVDSATHQPARVPGAPRALVLVPSRELALQVTANLSPLAATLGLRVSTVVGGTGYARQTQALAAGVDLLVATPGRLVDLIERQVCRLDAVEVTVLDEADYMADLGFLPVVTRLLALTPPGGQRLLFSATLDGGVAALVERFLDRPAVHAVAPATATVTAMTHRVFLLDREHKVQIAAEIAARPARTLFFVRTKHGAARLAKQLGRTGVDAAALHGNLAQNARQGVMAAFVEGRTRVLVATDVAARGLHVDDVDLVVHYDPPADPKDYLHRSGRTARAGSEGTVITFVHPDQIDDVRKLHQDAAVDPRVEKVAPGHHEVRLVASSGRPVRVAPRPVRTPPGPAGPPGRSGGRRSRRRDDQ
ncbi:MAG TPA: DEAD/DEAH box helicase [Kineosporiaceae bacterium]